MTECYTQNCASILPQLGIRVIVFDRGEGWIGEEEYGLEKWTRTRHWRSPGAMLRGWPFILLAMGLTAQDKRIQCVYWNAHFGKRKKNVLCALFTPIGQQRSYHNQIILK